MSPARIALLAAAAAGLALTGAAVSAADAPSRPETINLPDGFQPEGIDIGPGDVAYVGSLADGSIYRADLRTGKGQVSSPAVGSPSVGLEIDNRGRLFIAGGPSGTARVIDASTGALLKEYVLGRPLGPSAPGSLINDVVITKDAAYFTDSANPVLTGSRSPGPASCPPRTASRSSRSAATCGTTTTRRHSRPTASRPPPTAARSWSSRPGPACCSAWTRQQGRL